MARRGMKQATKAMAAYGKSKQHQKGDILGRYERGEEARQHKAWNKVLGKKESREGYKAAIHKLHKYGVAPVGVKKVVHAKPATGAVAKVRKKVK